MAEAWTSIAVADSCTHVIHWQSKRRRHPIETYEGDEVLGPNR